MSSTVVNGGDADPERHDVEEIQVYSDMDEEEVAEIEGLMAEANGPGGGAGGGGGGGGGDADFRMGGAPPPLRPSEGGKSTNTGPKGVKADYAQAKRDMINTRMRESMRAARKMKEMTQGVTELSVAAPELPQGRAAERAARRAEAAAARAKPADRNRVKKREEHERAEAAAESGEESSELSGLSSDDEDSFAQYRQQRLKYFHDSLPRFGGYERVSVEGIAAALRRVADSTVTIVHLYENDLETCTALNLAFESIAPQFKHVQFMRCRATEAMPGFSLAGLPALMVYRGTERGETMLRFVQPLGRNFSDEDVVAALEEKRLLSLPMPTLGELSKGYAG